jgi:hypothetical protein
MQWYLDVTCNYICSYRVPPTYSGILMPQYPSLLFLLAVYFDTSPANWMESIHDGMLQYSIEEYLIVKVWPSIWNCESICLRKRNSEFSWLEWGKGSFSMKPIFSDFIVNTLKNMTDIMTWVNIVTSSFSVTAWGIGINCPTI